MRLVVLVILIWSLSGSLLLAGEDIRRAQVAAATADALGSLQRDVLAAAVTDEFTVGDFVKKTASREALARTLRRAEQIGGTRWLDDQTCQVRMQLPGDEIADALIAIAQAKPQEAGLPADVLRRRIDPLREMTFVATGMSTSAIERLRPPPEQAAWRGVSEDAVRAAVNEARRNAAGQVLDSVEDIEFSAPNADARRFGDVISSDPKIRDALAGWLMNRPVTSVDFQNDLEVRVAVAVEGESFWDELSAAVGDRQDVPFPRDEQARAELRRRVLSRVEPTVGRAIAKAAGGTTRTAPRETRPATQVNLPLDPPRWIEDQVDAQGSSRAVDGRLKTARAAESVARERLRDRIEELRLTRQLTVGEAARRDARLRDAIDRAVQRARPRKVNYLADGGAEVSFSLDLRELWHEIERQ